MRVHGYQTLDTGSWAPRLGAVIAVHQLPQGKITVRELSERLRTKLMVTAEPKDRSAIWCQIADDESLASVIRQFADELAAG